LTVVATLTLTPLKSPRVHEEARVDIHELPAGLTRVILHFGFTETPSVPEGMHYAHEQAELSCEGLSSGVDP
jgi:KUP system potassium uptake protein